jgi:hypothetical protein
LAVALFPAGFLADDRLAAVPLLAEPELDRALLVP